MKMKYERDQGMTSIYRKLKKVCRSSNLRRHLTTLILAVVMMAPVGVYADLTGEILSEKRPGQAAEAGWADGNGSVVAQLIQFQGHGVVNAVWYGAAGEIFADETVHGSARLKVDTVGVSGEGDIHLQECDHEFICTPLGNDLRVRTLCGDQKVIVEFKGAFQQTDIDSGAGTQRGTLTLEITSGNPCP